MFLEISAIVGGTLCVMTWVSLHYANKLVSSKVDDQDNQNYKKLRRSAEDLDIVDHVGPLDRCFFCGTDSSEKNYPHDIVPYGSGMPSRREVGMTFRVNSLSCKTKRQFWSRQDQRIHVFWIEGRNVHVPGVWFMRFAVVGLPIRCGKK